MLRRLMLLTVAFGLLGSTGCRLLCDGYCERERDRCDRHCRDRCAPQCCNSSPTDNHVAPAPGTYYANPCR